MQRCRSQTADTAEHNCSGYSYLDALMQLRRIRKLLPARRTVHRYTRLDVVTPESHNETIVPDPPKELSYTRLDVVTRESHAR